jgi:hypothetical protein
LKWKKAASDTYYNYKASIFWSLNSLSWNETSQDICCLIISTFSKKESNYGELVREFIFTQPIILECHRKFQTFCTKPYTKFRLCLSIFSSEPIPSLRCGLHESKLYTRNIKISLWILLALSITTASCDRTFTQATGIIHWWH